MSDEAVLGVGEPDEDRSGDGVTCPSGSGGMAHVGDVRARDAAPGAPQAPRLPEAAT